MMKKGIVCLLTASALAGGDLHAAKQLTGQHAPANTPALSPAEAQKKFVLHDGFEARLFAAEPDVVNPVAMTWDDRGRLYVVELYEYPMGAPEGQKPRDRIIILEDTDNDGRADKRKVFADGLNLATAILWGNGGLYVGQAPHLLFIQDTDGDDAADQRTPLLSGFGLHDRHELLNGFTWGPDGWLYMTHGVFTHSKVKIPEATDDGVVMDAAVARFHPTTKKFELYADGTSNPWGVDFDKHGNAFVSACVIDHLFHMAPGGIYQRQGGTPGNPYAYELLPSIVDHKHHMAAYCGINIYQGNNFPSEYQGNVLMGNIHQNALNHDKLTPNGSTFKATAAKDFLTTPDGWFRPVVQNVGPDGALWVADWYDKYPCYQNAQADPEGVDRTHGRIWRVVYTGNQPGKKVGSRPETDMNVAKLDGATLVQSLGHPNIWQRRAAQRLLIETKPKEVAPALRKMIKEGAPMPAALHAFWTLHAANALTETDVAAAMNSSEIGLRIWAARSIGERRLHSERAINALAQLAMDREPAVRLAVATAVRQIVSGSLTVNSDLNTSAPVGKVLTALAQSSANSTEPVLPFLIWMASEPIVAANPEPGLAWLAQHGANTMPLAGVLSRKAMRRICDTGDTSKMDIAVRYLAEIAGHDSLLIATLDGLIEGQRAKPLPPSIDTTPIFEKLGSNNNSEVKERVQRLGATWGDAGAIAKTIQVINNTDASIEDRAQAIEACKQFKNDAAREALLKLISHKNPEPLVNAALRSLSAVGGDSVGNEIVKNWKNFTPRTRNAAVEVLVTRFLWTEALLNGVQDGIIATGDVSAGARRGIAKYDDANFKARSERLLGTFRETDADKAKLIKEKRKVALAGKPNLDRGRELAKASCFICHKLNGEGAEVGPDLTGVGRSTLDALLANVIDPNQVIGKGYENVVIETKDERSVSGRMIENTDKHVKLLGAGPTENVVAKTDIASMRVSESSVMPEGLEQLSDDDFRDLIWFVLSPPEEGALTPEKRKALIGKE